MRFLSAFLFVFAAAGTAHAEMSISYNWGQNCSEGKSPPIQLSGVPEGTVRFDIVVDAKNAGSLYRGFARPDYTRKKAPGHATFRYKTPCPPFGSHFYRLEVKALDRKGKTLAIAQAEK